ncbi:MAG: polyamine ABC transporter substrate-binding protein [Ostreibacterium sp.]
MKRCRLFKVFSVISTILITLIFAQITKADDRIVNVYNWSDYIDKSILTDFTKETGIKVNYDVFDTNELLETKLLTGASGFDVVVPSASFVTRQIAAGVYIKLDKSKLPNIKNVWEKIAKSTDIYDPGNQYTINYLWGTTAIGYVEEKIKAILPNMPANSWDMIFDPKVAGKLAKCGIYWLDAPTEMIPAALHYLGLKPGDFSKANIEKAEAVIAKVRPFIKKFDSSGYISALANGDICLAVGYSGDILQARDRAIEAKNGNTVVYTIPKEGAQMWFDQLAIPLDAKNKEEAYEFINYLLRPEVIAKASNYVRYANGNIRSQPFVDKDLLTDTAIYPDEKTMKVLYSTLMPKGKKQRMLNRSWTRIKSGQ